MSGGGQDGEFEVPWPAFVDLLTSVLITFMFFILLTTVVMSTMTVQVVNDMVEDKEKTEQNTSPEVSPTVITEVISSTLLPPPDTPQTPEQTEALREENEVLKQKLSQVEEQIANLRAPLNRATEIIVTPNGSQEIDLKFKRNEIGMLPETSSNIKEFLTNKGDPANIEVTLQAIEPPLLGRSQSREQALARALNVRNVLLASGVSAKSIRIEYLPASSDLQDVVRIKLK